MRCTSCNRAIQADSLFCKYCGQQQPKQPAAKQPTRYKRQPNGSGYVYKRGDTWTVRYRKYAGMPAKLNGKPGCAERTKGGFRTKAEAQAFLAQLQDVQKKDIPMTVAYYWSVIERDTLPTLAPSKQINYNTAYKRLKALHTRNVSDLTVADLRAVVAPIKTFYPAHDVKTLLQKIFDLATADNPNINHDLPSFIILPQKQEKEQHAFTTEEVAKIYAAYQNGDNFAGFILLMIYTSMMPGEFLKLERRMFDLPNHQIVGAGIKTKKRKQSAIVYPEWMAPVVQHLLSLNPEDQLIHGFTYYEKLNKAFKQTLANAGCRQLTPYACRHTTQTILALDPTTAPAARAAVMRHSIQEEERYTHIEHQFARQAVNQMPHPDQLPLLTSSPPEDADIS